MTYTNLSAARRDGWHVNDTILYMGNTYTRCRLSMTHKSYGNTSFEYRTDEMKDFEATQQALAWMSDQKDKYLVGQGA